MGGKIAPVLEPVVAERTQTAPLWRVILHNDEVTTQEFVVEVLVTLFAKARAEAVRLMLEVHNTGASTVTMCPQERAELYVEQVHSLARGRGYPLAASTEPA